MMSHRGGTDCLSISITDRDLLGRRFGWQPSRYEASRLDHMRVYFLQSLFMSALVLFIHCDIQGEILALHVGKALGEVDLTNVSLNIVDN